MASYDFTAVPISSSTPLPKMQITSKKIIPTSLQAVYDKVASGDLNNLGSQFNATRTPESVLTLELPNEMSMPTDFDWSFEEKNILQSILGNLNSNKTKDAVDDSNTGTISGIAQRIGVAAASAFGGDIAYRNAGYALAPLKEIFFNGNSNRTFPWTWDLYAKNEKESNLMMEACDRLREQVHPISQVEGVVSLPNEFEIEWINCNLPKISTCACTHFDTDYYAAGSQSFFQNGNPQFIRLIMTFTEIEIMTRNKLENMRSR